MSVFLNPDMLQQAPEQKRSSWDYTEALVANMVEVRTIEVALAQVPFAPGIEVDIEVRDA